MYEQKLKKCPFCGGEAEIYGFDINDGYHNYIPRCTKCFATIPVWRETEEEAIIQWNKRMDDAS